MASPSESPLCDIVIPVWNQPQMTRRCIESILRCTKQPIRLILIDNGSEAPTREYLSRLEAEGPAPVRLIRNEHNLGFIRATNQGIQAASAPWVCLLNNDTVVTSGWLAEMIRAAESDPRIGLVNPTSNSLGFHAGSTPLEVYAEKFKAESGRWTELPTALGFCLLARKSLFDRIGMLDEGYGMGNFDDDDLSRRVHSAGLLCARACGAYVWHEEKVSFRQLPGWEETFRRNRQRFEARWGRRLRILWILPPGGTLSAETARRLVREGHWITFVAMPKALPESVLSLAQVSQLRAGRATWRWQALWRLIAKRKKPYDKVVCEDAALLQWVERLRRFHPAAASQKIEGDGSVDLAPEQRAVPLSVVIITKNEESRLKECLDSAAWAREIVVVDDESTDRTAEIATSAGARILSRRMDVEGAHRNWAYAQAQHEWVFSLDADERVTPELAEEIKRLLTRPEEPEFEVYTVARRNYIGTRWIRHGGWYPSPQVKLFKRSVFRWEETTVHPRGISDRPTGRLRHDLIHLSYRDLSDFVEKLNRQTRLEAEKWVKDGRRMGPGKALWRTVDRFWRAYVGKQGHRDGDLGWILAGLAASYQWLSYLKYWEKKRRPRHREVREADRSNLGIASGASHLRNDKARVCAVVLAKNEAHRLGRCLEHLRWADEVVVVDDESQDETAQIARSFGARVLTRRSEGNFKAQRNAGTDAARGPWILQLDADEVVSKELVEEILARLKQDPAGKEAAGYRILRRNHFLGSVMRHGGWGGQRKVQLFMKGRARYTGSAVHERLEVEGPLKDLETPVDHYPFSSFGEFIRRQNVYTTVEAILYRQEHGAPPPRAVHRQLVFRPLKIFWKTYVKKRGFLDRQMGLFFAVLAGWVEFIRWSKIWELQGD